MIRCHIVTQYYVSTEVITDYGLGNCRALLLACYPFGRGPVALHPFVYMLTGNLQVPGSTSLPLSIDAGVWVVICLPYLFWKWGEGFD